MMEKKLKLLFYGFQHGHMDALYKLAQTTKKVEIVACMEEDEQVRAKAAERLGICFTEESYETWLNRDVDIVAVGDKYGRRGKAAIQALEAGKHLIGDKPLCTSLEELEQIETLAGEKHLKISCMLDLRYLPAVQTAKEILESGRLGAIRNIAFNGQHCMDYSHRPGWYFEEGMHGGTINDLAIHGVDLVRWLTGQEFVGVDGVRTWNAYAWKHPEFKDCAVFMARLSGGAEVLADVSYSAPSQVFGMPLYWEFRFWCEKGLMTFHLTDSRVILYEEGNMEPVELEGKCANTDYLTDLISEIEADTSELTGSILASSRTALMIQKEADK